MDENVFAHVVLNSERMKHEASGYAHKRYLYQELKSVPTGYFLGVWGLRGIGKTVLLLQLANETENSLYIAADHSYIQDDSLYDIARFALSKGYNNLFIDEIHHKNSWQSDLKTIYDEGEQRIFFSGSSALEIKKGADLSRRALLYNLRPLSFREYLVIKKGAGDIAALSAQELFDTAKRKDRILETSRFQAHLPEYFRFGGLIYPSDDTAYFYKALENTVEKIIHNDLEYLRAMNFNMENAIYKILHWIAVSPVGEVNYSSLASKIALSKPTLIRVLDDLARIGLVTRVLPCGKTAVRKEPKFYLTFPFREFFNSRLFKTSDTGSLREEFFVNHAENLCYLKGKRGEKTPDFTFAGKRVEVGGGGKTFYQNPDFLIKDGISFEEKTIPLYLAGFLY